MHERAAADTILANRYLTMATADADGSPWAAPLAYVVDDSGDLVYYSAMDAHHSRDIAARPVVACAIFDSSRLSDEADGVQLVGEVSEVGESELPVVMRLYFERSFPDAMVRARWSRPVSDFAGDSPQRFYRICITEAYRPDPSSAKVDRRVQLDVETLRSLLMS